MRMRTSLSLQGWTVVALLLGSTVYAIAEEFTLTTYYPSPRGVYRELRVGSVNVSGTPAFLHVVGDGTRPGFSVEAGSNTQLTVLGNGNVGINTGAPAQALEVVGNVAIGGDNSLMFLSGAGSSINGIGGLLHFFTGGQERVTIDAAGNVGIGTTSPSQKLDVNGNGLFTGTIIIEGGGPAVGKVWSATDNNGNGIWDYPKYAP